MKRKFEVEFAIDNAKAFSIAERLLDQFYKRKGFFEQYSMPEYVLPRNLTEGSREHALFLTYVISMDYMIDAVKLWKKSRGARAYSTAVSSIISPPPNFLKLKGLGISVFRLVTQIYPFTHTGFCCINLRKHTEPKTDVKNPYIRRIFTRQGIRQRLYRTINSHF